jgi:hypothetical protein
MGLRGSQSLRELYLEREELAVKWARGQGIGWRRVAGALGTTRHSLYARYRDSLRHLGASVVETRDLGEWMASERGKAKQAVGHARDGVVDEVDRAKDKLDEKK